MEIAGNLIIAVGVIFILFGAIGVFRFNNFFARILVVAKIDTVGVISLIIGIALKHGAGFFSLKLLLLLGIMLIINPMSAHVIARCAYLSGYSSENVNVRHDGDGGRA